jgi:hypothetical protein
VSNSSSSSFILQNERDILSAKSMGMEICKVSDIIKILKPIKKILEIKEKMYNSDLKLPNFIFENIYCDTGYYDELLELYKENKNVCITKPFDRDEAYRRDVAFKVFAGDL